MDLLEINNTIEILENEDTTFSNCEKLSTLYLCREFLVNKNNEDNTEQELNDILPQYRKYRDTKREYQLHKVSKEAVITDMSSVCKELKEFICTLYTSSDMIEERLQFYDLLSSLYDQFIVTPVKSSN